MALGKQRVGELRAEVKKRDIMRHSSMSRGELMRIIHQGADNRDMRAEMDRLAEAEGT